jgi:multiple sugar transport system substrate-binding protein
MPILKGMSWDHPRGFDPMVATAEEFTKKHPDYEIVWEKRSLQAFADRPIEQMAFDYDLMIIDHPHVGEASRKDLLIELDNHDQYKKNLEILTKQSVGVSHKSYEFNNHQFALAVDAATPVSAYRSDLIDKIPNTYEEVLSLAEKKKVMWPIKPVDSVSSFNTIAANIGNPINKNDQEFIGKNDGIFILEMMKRLADLNPRECLTMNPIETLEYMSTNDDIVYCPLLYGYSNYGRKNFRNSLINFSNIPSFNQDKNNCSGSQIGGTGLAISKTTKHLDVALEYTFWVASAECQKDLYYYSGGQPGNLEAWNDKSINTDCNNFFKDTLETLENAWLRPRFDGYMYYQDVAGTIINQYLLNDISSEKVIEELKIHFEKSFNVNKK